MLIAEILLIIGACAGIAVLIAKLIYSSKCKNFTCCWGCINCKDREVAIEQRVNLDASDRNMNVTNPTK
jgi:hypothetical protein